MGPNKEQPEELLAALQHQVPADASPSDQVEEADTRDELDEEVATQKQSSNTRHWFNTGKSSSRSASVADAYLANSAEELATDSYDLEEGAVSARTPLFTDSEEWLQSLSVIPAEIPAENSRDDQADTSEDSEESKDQEEEDSATSLSIIDSSETALADIRRQRKELPERIIPKLVKRAQKGSKKAKAFLVLHVLPAIVSMAFEISDFERADLVNEAVIHVLRAIEKCSPEQALYFRPYALNWARHAMDRYAHRRKLLLKITENDRKLANRAKRIGYEEGSEASLRAAAKELGVPKKSLREATAALAAASLMTPMYELKELDELISVHSIDDSPELLLESSEEISAARAAFSQLSSISQSILRLRTNSSERKRMTRKMVGRQFGITAERVRQIECAAREAFWRNYLSRFVDSSGETNSKDLPASSAIPLLGWQIGMSAVVLEQLKSSKPPLSPNLFAAMLEQQLRLHQDVLSQFCVFQDLEIAEISFFLKSQLLARGFIREAFGGSEILATNAGLDWLESIYTRLAKAPKPPKTPR